MNNEENFKGKIDSINFEMDWDGDNYMVIDGKHVIFDSPMRSGEDGGFDRSMWGEISGFQFLQGPERKEDAKKYYGKTAEVYAYFENGTDENQKIQKVYTLYGKKAYYIKLID